MRVARLAQSFSLKYAVGEVLLIVVGVLIALAASDWENGRDDRRSELAVLRELHSALESDLDQLRPTFERFQVIEASAQSLLDHLRSGGPYFDSLDVHFGAVYGTSFRVRPNTAAYESLKSQGLRLISDEGLRAHITRVYEQTYSDLEVAREGERRVMLDLRPYYQQHFRDLDFGRNATPLDYAAVASDQLFHNLVAYRLQTVRQNNLSILGRAVEQLEALSQAIQSELGGTET